MEVEFFLRRTFNVGIDNTSAGKVLTFKPQTSPTYCTYLLATEDLIQTKTNHAVPRAIGASSQPVRCHRRSIGTYTHRAATC